MTAKATLLIGVLLCGAALGGCVAALVGAGAATTVTAVDIAHERRTVGAYIDDGAIELKIRKYILSNKAIRKGTHLSVTSLNGIVLITGESRDAQTKNRVIDFAREVAGVRQVIDETEVAGKTGLMARTSDTWLTTKVKTTLFSKTGLDANRIKVVTERSTVYLMGVVTEAEADEAVEIVRHIDGVVRVVKVFEIVSPAKSPG